MDPHSYALLSVVSFADSHDSRIPERLLPKRMFPLSNFLSQILHPLLSAAPDKTT